MENLEKALCPQCLPSKTYLTVRHGERLLADRPQVTAICTGCRIRVRDTLRGWVLGRAHQAQLEGERGLAVTPLLKEASEALQWPLHPRDLQRAVGVRARSLRLPKAQGGGTLRVYYVNELIETLDKG